MKINFWVQLLTNPNQHTFVQENHMRNTKRRNIMGRILTFQNNYVLTLLYLWTLELKVAKSLSSLCIDVFMVSKT